MFALQNGKRQESAPRCSCNLLLPKISTFRSLPHKHPLCTAAADWVQFALVIHRLFAIQRLHSTSPPLPALSNMVHTNMDYRHPPVNCHQDHLARNLTSCMSDQSSREDQCIATALAPVEVASSHRKIFPSRSSRAPRRQSTHRGSKCNPLYRYCGAIGSAAPHTAAVGQVLPLEA